MKKILIFSFLLTINFLCCSQNAKDYFNNGISKFKLNDYKGAIADFNKAIEINPDEAILYFWRGNGKYALFDYRGAIIDYNKTIEINPKFAEAYLERGFAKLGLKQKDSACLDFSKAGELGYGDAYESIKEFCQ